MMHSDAPVEILPYDASWPEQFQTEAATLRVALEPWLLGSIEHIGSTAVPGLAAKPVIDILFGVSTLEASRPAIPAATRLGYCYAPYQVDRENWFCKPSFAVRTYHLHMVPVGCPEWLRPLAFRDYLRTHPDVAREYETLKRQLADVHRYDREAYTQAKTPFIDEITALALRTDRGVRLSP